MSNVSPVSATPEIAQFLALRKALDAQRTAADGLLSMLSPTAPAAAKTGTPAISSVSTGLDLHL